MKRKGIQNTEYIKAMRELRKSNASGIHQDKRHKRNRTRNAKLTNAIRDSVA